MKTIAVSTIIVLLFALSATEQKSRVNRVVDGDTFVLETGEKVRLIGVDCPESQDPNKPVEYWADKARFYLVKMIGNKTITLCPLIQVKRDFFENPFFAEDLTRINRMMDPQKTVPPDIWNTFLPDQQQKRIEQGVILSWHAVQVEFLGPVLC